MPELWEAKKAPNAFEEEAWLDLADYWTTLAEAFQQADQPTWHLRPPQLARLGPRKHRSCRSPHAPAFVASRWGHFCITPNGILTASPGARRLQVPEYKVYVLRDDDHLISRIDLICDGVEHAKQWAKALVDDKPVAQHPVLTCEGVEPWPPGKALLLMFEMGEPGALAPAGSVSAAPGLSLGSSGSSQ
jgi:hypothetical protein